MGQMASIGSSLMQFQETRKAGRFARQEAEIEATQRDIAGKQEELGAVQREGDRKRRLAEALASQNAAAGAGGVAAFEGSPLTILQQDVQREGVATERDIFETRGKALQQRIAGVAAKERGRFQEKALKKQAAIGLLSDIGQIAQSAPIPGG